jgi:hypothetical protein
MENLPAHPSGPNPDGTGTPPLGYFYYNTVDGCAYVLTESGWLAMSPAPQKRTFTIGDGVSKAFRLNHKLGTRDLLCQARSTSAPYDAVMLDVLFTDPNYVDLNSDLVLATNAVQVTLLG